MARDQTVRFRCTEGELAQLKQRAAERKMSVSDLIRSEVIRGAKVEVVKPPSATSKTRPAAPRFVHPADQPSETYEQRVKRLSLLMPASAAKRLAKQQEQ